MRPNIIKSNMVSCIHKKGEFLWVKQRILNFHFVLPFFFYDFYYNSILPFFFENYWVIVAFGVSAQLILMVLFHVKKPLVFTIYLLTNASIHLYILYIAEKIVIYSLI